MGVPFLDFHKWVLLFQLLVRSFVAQFVTTYLKKEVSALRRSTRSVVLGRVAPRHRSAETRIFFGIARRARVMRAQTASLWSKAKRDS